MKKIKLMQPKTCLSLLILASLQECFSALKAIGIQGSYIRDQRWPPAAKHVGPARVHLCPKSMYPTLSDSPLVYIAIIQTCFPPRNGFEIPSSVLRSHPSPSTPARSALAGSPQFARHGYGSIGAWKPLSVCVVGKCDLIWSVVSLPKLRGTSGRSQSKPLGNYTISKAVREATLSCKK